MGKISEKLKKISAEILKYWEITYNSIAVRISFVSILFVVAMLFFIPLFFDNSMLKFSLIQKISRATEADFDINGDVEVSFLPTPTVTINEAVLLNYKYKPTFSKNEELFNFYAKTIKIKFSILGIYEDKLANGIEFEDGFFEIFSDPKNIVQRNNKITEVLVGYKKLPAVSPTESGLSISNKIFKFSEIIDDDFRYYIQKIPYISFKNCAFSFFNKLGKNKDFNNINGYLNFSKDYYYGEGTISSENIVSKFEYQAIFNADSAKPKSYLYISSPNLEVKTKGNFTGENNGLMSSRFIGDTTINIKDFKNFYQTYFADEKSHIFSKLKSSNSPIKIYSNIENDKEELNFQNIKIESQIVNGGGDLYFAVHKETPIIDVNIDLENIDLDSIISQDAIKIENYDLSKTIDENRNDKLVDENTIDKTKIVNTPNQQENQTANNLSNTSSNNQIISNPLQSSPALDFNFKDFDIVGDIKIKTFKFFDNEFKDTNIYVSVNKTGEIMILPAIVKTPGNGSLYIRGIVKDTQTLPKFIGTIDFKGNNLNEVIAWLNLENNNLKFQNLNSFRIFSNVLMLPNYTALNEIYININKNETEIFGDSKIIRENKNATNIYNFEFSELDFTKYFVFKNDKSFFSNSQSLIKKMMWLNNINSNNQISLKFNKLIFDQQEFLDQRLDIKINHGYFNIDNLILKSPKTDLSANFKIDLGTTQPTFDLKIFAGKLQQLNLVNSNQDLTKPVISNDNLKNITNLFRNNEKQNSILEKFYEIPSLESFYGRIDIDVGEFTTKNKKISNIKFNGNLKNGTIESVKNSWQDFNGTLSFDGLIDLKETKIINGKFDLKNIELNKFLKDTLNTDSIGGVANISGNILSVASNAKEFFNDLKSEIRFNCVQPSIKNFGLNDLVKKMFNIKLYQSELKDPEKILFNKDANTYFKQAKGVISFKNNAEDTIKIELNAPATNAILSGTIDSQKMTFDWLFNAVFLTGNSQKQTPINLAIKIKGNANEYSSSANTNQIRQYLGLQNQTNKTSKEEFAPKTQEPQASNNSSSSTNPTVISNNNLPTQEPQAINGAQSTVNNPIQNQQPLSENINPTPKVPDLPSANIPSKNPPKNREEFKVLETDE